MPEMTLRVASYFAHDFFTVHRHDNLRQHQPPGSAPGGFFTSIGGFFTSIAASPCSHARALLPSLRLTPRKPSQSYRYYHEEIFMEYRL